MAHSRTRWHAGVAALAAALFLGAAVPPAPAAPAAAPTPLCCTPSGAVSAVAVSGTTAYFGGTFRRVGSFTGGFAPLDPGTGQLRAGWPDVTGSVRALAADGAGGWYLGGPFTAVGGVPRAGLAHIRADGSLDPVWAPSTNGFVLALAVAGAEVFVGGQFTSVNGGAARTALAAFDGATGAATAFVPAFTAIGPPRVNALQFRRADQPGSARLYVGGSFTSFAGTTRTNLAAWNVDTAAVAAFDPRPNGEVNALAVTGPPGSAASEWRVYAGGAFTSVAPNTSRLRLAAFNGETAALVLWDPRVNASVSAITASGSRVYASGTFTLVNDTVPRSNVAAFALNGTVDAGWRPSMPAGQQIHSLVAAGGKVYMGGLFTGVNGTGTNTPVPRGNLAAVDAVDGTVDAWDPEAQSTGLGVIALAFDGSTIAAGGDFTTAGGTLRRNLAAIDLATGRLLPFNPDLDGAVSALVVKGSRLYAGGSFTTVNGSTVRRRLAAFDTATGVATAFDPNLSGSPSALAASDDTIYAAGAFFSVNGALARDGLAGFDPDTGAARAFAPSLAAGTVNALAVQGKTVYAGGTFDQVNGADRRGLVAILDIAGTAGALTGFDADTQADDSVHSLVLAGGALFAAGLIDSVGTPPQPRTNLVAVDPDSGAVLPWIAGRDLLVDAITSANGQIVAGGNDLTALDPTSGVPADWTPAPSGLVAAVAASPEGGLVVGGSFQRIGGIRTGPLATFRLPPAAPAAPVATAGDGAATVSFPPPPNGGAPIESYTVTAFPGGRTVSGSGTTFAIDGLANGTAYTFVATATNGIGTSPASPPSNSVTPGRAAPDAPDARDVTRPLIAGLRMTRKRFAVAKGKTARSAAQRKAKRGTAFGFTLSEDARTAITVQRALAGRRKGKRCVKPRKGLKRKCTRYKTVHTLTRATTRAGANTTAYTGRIARKALKPSRYRATLRATDAAGNRSSPARVTFRIVRR